MRLKFAFLATAAAFSQDNQVQAFNIGLDNIVVDQLPGALPPLSIVAKFEADANEVDQPHTVSFFLTSPLGTRTQLGHTSRLNTIRHPVDPNLSTESAVISQALLMISHQGLFQIHIFVDDIEIHTINLRVFAQPQDEPEQTYATAR